MLAISVPSPLPRGLLAKQIQGLQLFRQYPCLLARAALDHLAFYIVHRTKVLTTKVGEPLSPHFSGSAPTSCAVHTGMTAFFAFITPLNEGIRGSLISFTTVITAGNRILTTSYPSSVILWQMI
jgi:hypothetical protein